MRNSHFMRIMEQQDTAGLLIHKNITLEQDYTFDESTKKFTLTGTIKQLTWKDNHDEIVAKKLYSCLNTSCNVVYKVTGYQNDTTMTVQPISYSSDSYADAVTNTTNSTMKNTLDTWYKNNLTSYASYLADETFCSDRKINWGNGYLTTPTTYLWGIWTFI